MGYIQRTFLQYPYRFRRQKHRLRPNALLFGTPKTPRSTSSLILHSSHADTLNRSLSCLYKYLLKRCQLVDAKISDGSDQFTCQFTNIFIFRFFMRDCTLLRQRESPQHTHASILNRYCNVSKSSLFCTVVCLQSPESCCLPQVNHTRTLVELLHPVYVSGRIHFYLARHNHAAQPPKHGCISPTRNHSSLSRRTQHRPATANLISRHTSKSIHTARSSLQSICFARKNCRKTRAATACLTRPIILDGFLVPPRAVHKPSQVSSHRNCALPVHKTTRN
jgi:hypothetical protein